MKTTYYLLLCGIFLFGCVEREEPQYYEVPLTMIVKIQNGILDTVNTEIEDEYTLVRLLTPNGEQLIEFFKNGKNILRIQPEVNYRLESFHSDPIRKVTEYIYMNEETTISFLRIDSIAQNDWSATKLFRDHVLIKNFPFEGINCFSYED
jgi:hypothetical protein